jgi:rubrerythrin
VSVGRAVESDERLARVLQVGVVLEELVEARAYEHYRSLAEEAGGVDADIEELLLEAREESGEHRERLERLIDDLNAESVPFAEIEALVQEKYGRSKPESIEAVLTDQRASEETAFNYYDGVIDAIESSETDYGLDRERLLSTLRDIRAEEAEGAEEVQEVIDAR